MNRELFYSNQVDQRSKTAKFDAFESQHISKALRKTEGETIEFTDGKGNAYRGSIICSKPVVEVSFNSLDTTGQPPISDALLAVGFIRHNRMDIIIEKCTELGIHRFFLFSARYSNYFTENTSHWQKIMRQAMKQSLRYTLPEIIICATFNDFLSRTKDINNKYIAEQNAAIIHTNDMVKPESNMSNDTIFAIGPEGGFTESEQHAAHSAGYKPLSFGKHRLRTETAAIAAASYINLIQETGVTKNQVTHPKSLS
jgi:16S rRNA (uracil1498-N3)-methyltransferase